MGVYKSPTSAILLGREGYMRAEAYEFTPDSTPTQGIKEIEECALRWAQKTSETNWHCFSGLSSSGETFNADNYVEEMSKSSLLELSEDKVRELKKHFEQHKEEWMAVCFIFKMLGR